MLMLANGTGNFLRLALPEYLKNFEFFFFLMTARTEATTRVLSPPRGTAPQRQRNIKRPRVHTEVLNCLLDDIRAGVYREGQKMPSERTLMEEFGVGRPAVREALSALGRMGLLEIRAGMRARVCKIKLEPLLSEVRASLQIYSSSTDGWRHVHGLRLLFETAVVRRLAAQVTDAQALFLRGILEKQRNFLDEGEIRAFSEADIEFHCALVECLENPFMDRLARGFGGWLISPLYQSMQMSEQSERSYRAHAEVLDWLEKHDPTRAEEAMREHLEEMGEIYLRGLTVVDGTKDAPQA